MQALALVLLAACATAPPEGPRALRSPAQAEEARTTPELARFRTLGRTAPGSRFSFAWDPEADHERVKQQHGEAAAIEKSFEEACHQQEVAKTIGSPLTRHRIGGWKTEDGVIVLLGAVAGPKQTLLADLRCYRAWLMAGAGVDKDSPLALPGLLVDVKGNQQGITLTLTLKDTALIPELQRRVLRQVDDMRTLPRHED